ncbi:unnamed protein product [Brassicogethes aeneus]|uniref:Peptidase M3A/M3B catalytic domain-containing protein n=1 Tax=Brassicogethes aeneus TaxID=1431903 RepID=A0A9P0AS99_BRAAE|nr:unnamed protein product [Brassicogethes aeneus]
MAMTFCGKRLLLTKNSIFTTLRKQHGFIVLVPEIGEDSPEKNPLHHDGLPEFSNISIEYCQAAIAKQTLEFEASVKSIEKKIENNECKDVFNDVFKPLEQVGAPLDMTWGLSKTLYLGNSSKMPTKSYLGIHDRARRARTSKYNSVPIYNVAKNELEMDDAQHSKEEKRLLQKFVLEGKLNGMELDSKQKELLIYSLRKIAVEKANFRQKIDIANKQFSHVIDDSKIVRDFPPETLKATAPDPNKPLNGPWKLSLQPHVYLSVMEHCPVREIRWNLWQAMVSRGSNYISRELSTSIHLEEIRFIRRDIAKILGYETFVDMSMETKMAGSLSTVQNMFNVLLEQALPAQEEEINNLYKFATDRGFRSERIELWDVPYWRRKQKKTLFGYDDEVIKEYLPLNKVLDGLFQLCEKLFNIVIKQRSNVSVWHKDVKYYDIFEPHSSAPVAGFYLDPYARSDEKIRTQNNGWMVAIQNNSSIADTKPLSALVFNFEPPTAKHPSHLTFTEVKALFQRFGHAMQHLLTRAVYSEVAGLSNVEWDAVEISGHVLTHWLNKKEIIDSITCHRDSEDKLPTTLFNALMSNQKHMAGLDLSRELYLSALDLEIHSTKDFWLDIVKRLWPQYRLFPLDKYDSHPCSFTQIFCDEWGAAYYSNLWSRMIAADVYSAFHEVQNDEQKLKDVGKRFRDTFLALGGSSHPSQIFRNFRGRDPSPKALLRSIGLKKSKC